MHVRTAIQQFYPPTKTFIPPKNKFLATPLPGHAPLLKFYFYVHPYAKFEVCSFTRFGDMFEGVPNFIRVT